MWQLWFSNNFTPVTSAILLIYIVDDDEFFMVVRRNQNDTFCVNIFALKLTSLYSNIFQEH